MAAIFAASSVSNPPMPAAVSDASLHAAVYAGLTLLLVRAFAGARWSGVTPRTLALAWLVAVGYGVTDEWHQSFVPQRFADSRDIAANAAGALAAALAAGAWSIIRRS